MKDSIIITLKENSEKIVSREGITVYEFLKHQGDYEDVIAVTLDGDVAELNTVLKKDVELGLIKFSERSGTKIYRNGLKYVYITAIKELFGKNVNLRLKHSIDKSIYSELDLGKNLTEGIIKKIKDKMKELVERDIPIEKISTTRRSAIEYFTESDEFEKVENYKQISNGYVSIYELLEYYNYFYYFLPISTGAIKYFDLTLVSPKGIVLQYPDTGSSKIPKYTHMKSIFNVFREYSEKLEKLNIRYVSDVNKLISNGKIRDFIQINEMMHNDTMKEITDRITSNRKIKLVLIGGPSCSGKTTTSMKLGLYFKSKGLNPFIISTDDYYVDRKDSPKDEHGNNDYETIDAIDLKLFNSQLQKLLKGEKVSMPTFNFITGEKEYKKPPVELKKNDIILIEGLHTLNEEFSKNIDKSNKFKIYASPFTPIALDRHNHVSTTDVRLLRRLVRDNARRGYNAEVTLTNWRNMRKSEEKYVFPYQTEADAVVNTALIYEVNALRTYAEPLLYSIDPQSDNYKEAIRLINFLKCFFCIADENIPDTSVLREFIGKSYFE